VGLDDARASQDSNVRAECFQKLPACAAVVIVKLVSRNGESTDESGDGRRNLLSGNAREELLAFLISKRRHLLDQYPGHQAPAQKDAQHLPPIWMIVKNQKGKSQCHRIIPSRAGTRLASLGGGRSGLCSSVEVDRWNRQTKEDATAQVG
jgi:hypothetical protein